MAAGQAAPYPEEKSGELEKPSPRDVVDTIQDHMGSETSSLTRAKRLTAKSLKLRRRTVGSPAALRTSGPTQRYASRIMVVVSSFFFKTRTTKFTFFVAKIHPSPQNVMKRKQTRARRCRGSESGIPVLFNQSEQLLGNRLLRHVVEKLMKAALQPDFERIFPLSSFLPCGTGLCVLGRHPQPPRDLFITVRVRRRRRIDRHNLTRPRMRSPQRLLAWLNQEPRRNHSIRLPWRGRYGGWPRHAAPQRADAACHPPEDHQPSRPPADAGRGKPGFSPCQPRSP